jgi:hypothetical protein
VAVLVVLHDLVNGFLSAIAERLDADRGAHPRLFGADRRHDLRLVAHWLVCRLCGRLVRDHGFPPGSVRADTPDRLASVPHEAYRHALERPIARVAIWLRIALIADLPRR